MMSENPEGETGAGPDEVAGAEPPTIETPPGPTPKHLLGRWSLPAGRVLVALLSVLILVAAGVEWQIRARADEGLDRNSITEALVTDDPNIIPPSTPAPAVQTVGGVPITTAATAPDAGRTYAAENILLIGSDTRAGDNGNAGNMGPGAGDSAQSDTVMIAHISADRQHVTVLALPRDLWVTAPVCKAWDYRTGKILPEDYDNQFSEWKITNAFSVGGPQCLVRAVQLLTGIRIDRLIGIDFSGFKAMVDAVDGVTVDICTPIIDAELGTVIPTAGVQTVRGDTALNLVRARTVDGDPSGDLGRIRRQQVVLSAVLRQVVSAGTLANPLRLDAVLQAFVQNTFTQNVTLDDLLALASSFGNLDPSKITFFTLPTVPGSGDGVDPGPDSAAVFAAIRNDALLPGEKPTVAPSTTSAPTGPAPGSTAPHPEGTAATGRTRTPDTGYGQIPALASGTTNPAGSSGEVLASVTADLSPVDAGSAHCA